MIWRFEFAIVQEDLEEQVADIPFELLQQARSSGKLPQINKSKEIQTLAVMNSNMGDFLGLSCIESRVDVFFSHMYFCIIGRCWIIFFTWASSIGS